MKAKISRGYKNGYFCTYRLEYIKILTPDLDSATKNSWETSVVSRETKIPKRLPNN